MFDLFRSRDKAVRIMLGVILGIVAISMVTYLIPGATGGGSGAVDENVIAKIGDDKVTSQAALQAVSNSMQGRKIPPQMIGYFAPQVIDGLINQRAVAYEAKRLGIQVSDDDVAAAVRAQLPASLIDKDGKIKEDLLAQVLSQQNATVQQFVDDTRRSLMVSRLSQLIQRGVVVTKGDVEREFKQKNEKIKIEYVLFKPAFFEQQVQMAPADIEAYFKKNQQTYQTPEKKSLAIVLLDSNKVASGRHAHRRRSAECLQLQSGSLPHPGAREDSSYPDRHRCRHE